MTAGTEQKGRAHQAGVVQMKARGGGVQVQSLSWVGQAVETPEEF
jgi:hypothetical protein